MRRQNVRTLSLVVCTFTYLLIGAAVFDALESDTDSRNENTLLHIRDTLIAKYNLSASDYNVIETLIIAKQPHKAGRQWKFAGALYFVTVVVAMIGYGHSTPATIPGKAFCLVYAAIGIPLGMVMFQSIGERLNKFTSVVIKKMKKAFRFPNTDATEVNQLMVTGTLSSLMMTVWAYIFSQKEGWSYIDSFYYCFITLTTIGFGDYVALQKDDALTKDPSYVALSIIFIMFGLTVVAASINLLILRFMTINTEDIKTVDYEMQDAHQSVVTLDGELMAVDGKLLGTGACNAGTMEGNPMGSFTSVVTVCSCTCYPRPYISPRGSTRRHRSPSRFSQLLLDPNPDDPRTPYETEIRSPLMHEIATYLKTKRVSV